MAESYRTKLIRSLILKGFGFSEEDFQALEGEKGFGAAHEEACRHQKETKRWIVEKLVGYENRPEDCSCFLDYTMGRMEHEATCPSQKGDS